MSSGPHQDIPNSSSETSTSAPQGSITPRPDSPITAAASRFNDEDVGGNPQDSDVISIERLSVRPPSTSMTESPHVHPTPLVSQAAGLPKLLKMLINQVILPVLSETLYQSLYHVDELLTAASKSMEPNQVPFSTMSGTWVPLFRRSKVVKKSSKEPVVPTIDVIPPATAKTSTAIFGKRLAPSEARRHYSQKAKVHWS
ncbi:hypothetical protein LIER_39689 [Lithospermum erythrorhizon]|uniref:Uncharacterized protein n=1 Tax=Lithospermum erythrorhizon TaxID=34254 RepID=A0AAV3QIP8_LITER